MTSSISRLIRWVGITRQGKDDKKLPIQQVGYLGKVADCVMIFPYGMHANVDGDSLTLMFAVGGDDDNKAGIPTSGTRRQQLAPGEVMVYSPVTMDSVIFKAGGGVDVTTSGDLNAIVGGSLNATVTGNIVASAASTTVTSGTITLDGDVAITGNLTVGGTATVTGVTTVGGLISTGAAGGASLTGTVTINGKTLDGHVHTDPQGGNTGPF